MQKIRSTLPIAHKTKKKLLNRYAQSTRGEKSSYLEFFKLGGGKLGGDGMGYIREVDQQDVEGELDLVNAMDLNKPLPTDFFFFNPSYEYHLLPAYFQAKMKSTYDSQKRQGYGMGGSGGGINTKSMQRSRKKEFGQQKLGGNVIGEKEEKIAAKMSSLCKKSCFFFTIENKVRVHCIWTLENVWFDRIILMLIVWNSVLYAIQDYRSIPGNWQAELMDKMEVWFLLAFGGEMTVKIIGLGFMLDNHSYLRDYWNWLDFTVVVTGTFSFFISLGQDPEDKESGVGVLRLFRIMRPLRTLSASPGMRKLVATVFSSVPKLTPVLGMGLFLFLLFSIVGKNFFGGNTHRICRMMEFPMELLIPEKYGEFYEVALGAAAGNLTSSQSDLSGHESDNQLIPDHLTEVWFPSSVLFKEDGEKEDGEKEGGNSNKEDGEKVEGNSSENNIKAESSNYFLPKEAVYPNSEFLFRSQKDFEMACSVKMEEKCNDAAVYADNKEACDIYKEYRGQKIYNAQYRDYELKDPIGIIHTLLFYTLL